MRSPFQPYHTSCSTVERSKADANMEVVPPESPSSGSSQETDGGAGEEPDSSARQSQTIDAGEGLPQTFPTMQ